MNHLHAPLLTAMSAYPDRSQCETEDPIVAAKLFLLGGAATWWLTEYDAEERIAFGYVTGMAFDEWGSASIDELEALQYGPIPRVEFDVNFRPMPFSALKAQGFRA